MSIIGVFSVSLGKVAEAAVEVSYDIKLSSLLVDANVSTVNSNSVVLGFVSIRVSTVDVIATVCSGILAVETVVVVSVALETYTVEIALELPIGCDASTIGVCVVAISLGIEVDTLAAIIVVSTILAVIDKAVKMND